MAHDARRGVAERRPAAMAHVHRAGGVGGDVLEVDLALAFRHLALAEVALLGTRLGDDALQNGRGQADIDEAGAGDLHGLHQVVFWHVVDDGLGHLARVPLRELRRTQSHRGGPVAVPFVARALERRLGRLRERERPVFDGGRLDQLFELIANLHDVRLSYESDKSPGRTGAWGRL